MAALKAGQGNLSPCRTEATVASRKISNTNFASLPVTARAGRAAGKAGSVPAKGPTVSYSRGTTHQDIIGDAQDARLRLSFGKVGAMLGPAAWGILGCE